MEKRLNGLLASIRVLREPYEAFYTSLDNRQKKPYLDGLGPSRRGGGRGNDTMTTAGML